MALPASGAISMSQVNTEIGASSTAQISLNDSAVRSLFGKASGAIAMSDGYGKSSQFAFTVSSSAQNANLRTLALAAGWNGSSKVVATVASGVYLWTSSTATAGLIIDGSWPGGVDLINNGFIMGQGGRGTGSNGASSSILASTVGGPAISLGVSCAIQSSSGYIGGGGGGGGGNSALGGGGGAGGGAGGNAYSVPKAGAEFRAGGAGGSIGNAGGSGATVSGTPPTGGGSGGGGGANASIATFRAMSGAGGGRIMPGSGGAGGVQGAGVGGAGGSGGSSGGNGSLGDGGGGGGGGGYGASGGAGYAGENPGSSGGKAVALNGYSVTWTGGFPTGRVFGAVS